MSTRCDGCNGKGSWFSPMRGDVECDWCKGEGKLCDCPMTTNNGTKCWRCGFCRPKNEESDELAWMDGDDGWRIADTDPNFHLKSHSDWKARMRFLEKYSSYCMTPGS